MNKSAIFSRIYNFGIYNYNYIYGVITDILFSVCEYVVELYKMAKPRFNEFGKNHHNEFYTDLQTIQVQTNGNVRMSLFSNAEGTVYANDTAGNPINNRYLKYTMYTNPYYHPYDGNIPGALTIHFLDGTFYKKIDTEDPVNPVCWYSFLDLVPLAVKPLT